MVFNGASLPRWSFLLVILVWWTGQSVTASEVGHACKNPIGESGKCIYFQDCQPLVNLYNDPFQTPEDTEFLTQSRCGVHRRKILVCCAVSNLGQRSSLPEPPNCGIQMSDRVFGGHDTKINEFPWTALIQFQKPGGSFGFHCGGSLINERYVVTAAHCIKSIPRSWKVHRVRLGEWDLSMANDCQDDFCSNAPIDLDVEKIVVHSNYDPYNGSFENDIALLRLTRPVDYSETVRPICLPLSASLHNLNHVGQPSYTVGWGKTETDTENEVKLMVELNITNLQECARIYQEQGVTLKTTQMCAGGVRGKDSCSGDSGGPLMRQIAGAWYLIGVVSFGPNKCGTAGIPGVYTNVAEYVDWIQDNIY
ncbi:CLIP domain-containing serine protease B4-like [Anopheles marshallii]|uniref:CLIP domain-containing serine protease B4-like n=1 Tax=Anopheles marshallii TaxID=1521116 RepID=UPI00237A5B7D|nr:CLIP domain-containing serine protease B4-like [Anopheles marshallii]